MKKMRELGKVFRVLKHRKPSKKYCPRCGSPEIQLIMDFGFGFTPQKYVCKNCGYVGPIVMELEKAEKGDKDNSG